jgi:hypothetical protein
MGETGWRAAGASQAAHAGARLAAERLSLWAPMPNLSASDRRAVRRACGCLRDRRLRAAVRVAETGRALAEVRPMSILRAPGLPLGPAWPAHPALQGPAPRLHERQITEALAEILAARGRGRGLLRLLCQLGGRQDLLATLGSSTRVQVEAEVALQRVSRHLAEDRRGSPRRIDLLFRWPVEAERDGEAVAVVEAKLKAALGPGQLKAYGAEGRKLARGSGLGPGLFVVGLVRPRRRELPPAWSFLHWAAVMRRWEGELAQAGDADAAFAALRAQLWRASGLMGER